MHKLCDLISTFETSNSLTVNNYSNLPLNSIIKTLESRTEEELHKSAEISAYIDSLNNQQYNQLQNFVGKILSGPETLKEKINIIIDSITNPAVLLDLVGAKKDETIQQEFTHNDSAERKQPNNLTRQLLTLSAAGSDQTLATHGNNPHYWYSIMDSFALLSAIRRERLNYTLPPNPTTKKESIIPPEHSKTNPAEEYDCYNENSQHIFLANPYITQNFAISFADDINTITSRHEGELANRNHCWLKMPALLIIPLLTGQHWRAIRIEVNYENKAVSILWDDPYGRDKFPKEFKNYFGNIIHKQLTKLFKTHLRINNNKNLAKKFKFSEIKIFEYEKLIQQQKKSNDWDCGPIVFSNINAYISTRSNEDFIHETSGKFYKINSEEQIVSICDEHSKIYSHITQNQQ